MSVQTTITDIGAIDAPWGKKITLQNIAYEGGISFVRLRIQENTRFTDLELDPMTAGKLGRMISEWVAENPPPGE